MSDNEINVKRRRKGEGTVQSERKRCRSEGRSYVNVKNNPIDAKLEPKTEVGCKCKQKCRELCHDHKTKLFHNFYGLKDNTKQNSYLMGLIIICPIKRRRHGQYNKPEDSKKQVTIKYSVPDGSGNVVPMCKKTFMDIFAITKRRVETLVRSKKMGNIVYQETRGNKQKHRKYSSDDEKLVIEHINSFPREQSHYSRKKSDREYLSQDLNIHRLYAAFKEKYPESNITYRYYYTIKKTKFPQLSFHRPRTDTCEKCDLLKIQSKDSNNKVASQKLQLHLRRAENARMNMKNDHTKSQLPSSDNCTISIDLQQVLSLPALTHSRMYYLRQLSCFNFGIHIGDSNKGYMSLWHEGMSGRGGNQIASCILKAVTCEITYKPNLTVWSDNCIRQNKNKMLLFLWIYLTITGKFNEVNHKYLVSGHSYLSCDRDFAQIEKRKRVKQCEIPRDLLEVIVTATPSNPFFVTLMDSDDFYDFKNAAERILKTTALKITQCNWIKITKENPGVVLTRKTFSEFEPWESVRVLKKNVTADTVKNMLLPPLQHGSRLSDDKKKGFKGDNSVFKKRE